MFYTDETTKTARAFADLPDDQQELVLELLSEASRSSETPEQQDSYELAFALVRAAANGYGDPKGEEEERERQQRKAEREAAKPVELAYDGGWHDAFQGATSFGDDDPPLFAEVEFDQAVYGRSDAASPYTRGATCYGTSGVLVLDAGNDQAPTPTLTLNVWTEDGLAAAFVKEFKPRSSAPAARSFAQGWAETLVPKRVSAARLLQLGFRFEEY